MRVRIVLWTSITTFRARGAALLPGSRWITVAAPAIENVLGLLERQLDAMYEGQWELASLTELGVIADPKTAQELVTAWEMAA